MPPPIYTDEKKRAVAKLYPGKIMVIVTKAKQFPYVWHQETTTDTVKIAAPENATVQYLNMEIHKLLKSMNESVTDSIYLMCGNNIIGTNYDMISLEKQYGKDRFIYLTLNGENTFG
jgi:hypothetical protein